jgi:hypothetical protein
MVLENMFEFNNILVSQGFVNFDLCNQLHRKMSTFCLALERFSELFAMILAARILFVYRFVTS